MTRRTHLSNSNPPEACRSWHGEIYQSPHAEPSHYFHASLAMFDIQITFNNAAPPLTISAARVTGEIPCITLRDTEDRIVAKYGDVASIKRLGKTPPTYGDLEARLAEQSATIVRLQKKESILSSAVSNCERMSARVPFLGRGRVLGVIERHCDLALAKVRALDL